MHVILFSGLKHRPQTQNRMKQTRELMKEQVGVLTLVGLLAFCSTSSAQYVAVPTNVAGAGLSYVVPDMLLWYHTNNYLTNGPITVGAAVPNSTIWDAYVSVLGDSTFLIANVTYSDTFPDGQKNETFALAFQPAAGGPPTLGREFYADNGTPYSGVISARKTGSPGRVAADKRYGAVNFLTGANCTAGNPAYSGTAFQSNSRWSDTAKYASGTARYNVEQIFSFNPVTLAQAPLTLCSDFLGDAPNAAFGDVLALDNGNFAIVYDDSSHILSTRESASVVIVKPDGSVVTPPFLVDPSAGSGLWANCAAYRGGFCVRYNLGNFYFYDNAGNLRGPAVPQDPLGLGFSTDRGDTTRIASDIRSHYVYLAGTAPWNSSATVQSPVMLAIFDANTMQFVTATNVSDTDPDVHGIKAVNVAVDALDRVIVAYDCRPNLTDFSRPQVVARLMQFDGTNVNYLTPSFFPFVNNDPVGTNTVAGLLTQTPGLAMTTRQICISAKGVVNSTNNPAGGPDTPPDDNGATVGGIDFYTIINQPAPVAAPRPQMTLVYGSPNSTISWVADAGLFLLQSSSTPAVPASWTDVSPQPAIARVGPGNATDQYQMTVPTSAAPNYYRLVRHW